VTDYDAFLSATGRDLAESAIRRMGTVVAAAHDLVSFAPGYPAPELFPWPELRLIAADLLDGTDADTLQYGPTRGYAPLLESIRGILAARHIDVALDQLLITSGSQQGIDLIARVIVSPGDVVLVELPTFTGGIAAFRNARAELAGVRQDDHGIDLDDLDAVWTQAHRRGKRVKLLYIIPNFQNPTGRLLSRERRQQVLDWAERRDVLIVEDDPYGSLYFEDAASADDTRPMRADDSRGRVLYLSSFSKTLAPGFRVGWMVAPAVLVERFETAKQSTDLTSGILDQRLVDEAIRRGVVDALAPTLRARYQHKRTVMETAMRGAFGNRLSWPSPKGGFFLWVTLPPGESDTALFERALQHGVIFVVGSAFFVDGSGHDTIRLSFSAPSPERITEGVERLAAAFRAPPLGEAAFPASR
jgi:2-aminoadipate transaminase